MGSKILRVFDLEREFRIAESFIRMTINRSAYLAIQRINDMHTVGSGICYCGASMDEHPEWDNHAPIEMMRDKDYYA